MKKMNSGRSELSIPQEIIFEIFSWLPAKSLMRFKCVSRFCNSIVSESGFLDIHKCRSGGTKLLLRGKGVYYTAEEKKDGKASASILQVDRFNKLHDPADSRLTFVDGLFFCCLSSSVQPAVIFNPSTNEVRFLPDLLPDSNKGICWHYYLLGFEPEEKKYKVLSSTYHDQEEYTKYWVFTLGIDKSWRETQSIFPYIPYWIASVCISGVIYQFAKADHISVIAAFDVKSEKFEIIALWNAIELMWYYTLIEVKGKLAVIDYEKGVSGYIHLWILEQTPRKEWERHIICVPMIWNNTKPRFASSFMARDGEIVFVVNLKLGDFCCLCYDLTRKSWRELKIKGLHKESFIYGIYSYVENLVPFG